jgi:hypothetical protein
VATVLESFQVESPQHGKAFSIDLADGLDTDHMEFMELQWNPLLRRQYNLALLNFFQLPVAQQSDQKWQEILGSYGCHDAHWNWRAKSTLASSTNRTILSLLNQREVEAAMALLFGKQCRDGTPRPMVYVDYVAVAPWNRREIQNTQRFRHLGTVMLGAAVARSFSLGLDGRCGLHSLRQAEGFYHRIGMTDFGLDPSYESLRYFEFTSDAARAFIQRGVV